MKKILIVLMLLLSLTACAEKKDNKETVAALRKSPEYLSYSEYNIRNDYDPYYTFEGENENFKAVYTIKPIDQSIIEQYSEKFPTNDKLTAKSLQVDCYLTYKGDLAESDLDLPDMLDVTLFINYSSGGSSLSGPRLVSVLDGKSALLSSYEFFSDFDFEKGKSDLIESNNTVKLTSKTKSDSNKDFNFELTLNRVDKK